MKRLFLCLLVGMILAWAYPAHSATVIYDGSNAVGINNLQVGSTYYNVQFLHDSFNDLWPSGSNPEFWRDESGAENASDAINSVLNEESPVPAVTTDSLWVYNVPFQETEDGKIEVVVNILHADIVRRWGRNSSTGTLDPDVDRSYAKFTIVPVPPALLLLGSGLVAIVGIRRKTGVRG
ncbi:MAG: hypothetical protein JRG77_02010 [Deltaproteobacteria bacterium]|nr:hypothetical protein [Deltaproteobacteria bacterium]MBW2097585.1 hypothetical protein [Deltaproteobacteria bacterium]